MSRHISYTVTAPASSGNLGPGFDVLALALDLRNRVDIRPGSGRVHVDGHGASTIPTDPAINLVATSFATAAGMSIADAGIDLHCTNVIHPARGLGSSTAAAACGFVAGWHHANVDWDDDQLFNALHAVDGHPDNAAACAYGGVVLCHDRSDDEGDSDVVTFGALDWLRFIAAVPTRELATAEARAAVPTSFSRRDLVRSVGSASLLVGGLLGGHPELVEDALECDVVHEPYRASLVPELAEVRAAAASTNALGVTLSGAGPTVLVWLEPDDVDQAMGSLAIDFPQLELLPLTCAAEGTRVER